MTDLVAKVAQIFGNLLSYLPKNVNFKKNMLKLLFWQLLDKIGLLIQHLVTLNVAEKRGLALNEIR